MEFLPQINTKNFKNQWCFPFQFIMPSNDDVGTISSQKRNSSSNSSNGDGALNQNGDETCTTCSNKECCGTTGKQGRQHRQLLPSKWIECDMCQKWYHGTCQGLQVAEVNMITNKLAMKGVKWYWDTCLPNFDGAKVSDSTANMKKFHNLEQMIANLGGKIELYQKETTEQVKKIEKSWAEVASQGEMANNVERALAVTSSTQAILSKELDKKDKEARKNNAILYGLQETETTAFEQVQEFMKREMFERTNPSETAIRLSQKTNDKTRPVKLHFSDEKSKSKESELQRT